MNRSLTAAERILRDHGMTGYSVDETRVRVLEEWSDNGSLVTAWTTLTINPDELGGEDCPLMHWLGY